MANKVGFYLAQSEEEYNLAIAYLQAEDTVVDIRKLGPMSSSDFFGNDVDAWVIVYSAPNGIGTNFSKFMRHPELVII